ncbi:hypothetical protein TVAG_439730 [Trichomonas vaginalis G3]|uniref:Uncharacterized protein n=1 Tax=Trichomonas vaginalis (strain ATCC PRA-98 / G3) TaxID=412133 RepID=A2FMK2_TRIV3|nr:sperm-tail PG-rich repeat family [Trichomonas vaginalis G3]EAX93870.1 hypothetical protein TVAG_439730 [Trichomonas vaginalis G3]KAI5536864.1 sperm-tail PG-rich repeat family [Trichomonas vaginalis G3]|eukprot:XP_001306800.1 hypothetical protein [Trichomonas vaginalis G3]
MTSTATIIHATSTALQTPGPGAYVPPSTFGNESPKYTIRHRLKNKENVTGIPYQAIPSEFGTGHKYTFGIRPKEKEREQSPGPNYVPPQFGSDAPKTTWHPRTVSKEMAQSTPGPLTYDDPTKKSSPKFTMKARKFTRDEGVIDSPGPAAYMPNYSVVLPSARRNTIHSRSPDPKNKFVTPGPYDVKDLDKPHGISFHFKHKEPKFDQTPGPKYHTERQTGADAPKLTIRPRYATKENILAAPYQKYPEIFGTGSPKRSFGIRPAESKKETTPGPNYMPPEFGSQSPRISFHYKPQEPKAKATSPGPNYLPTDTSEKRYTIKGRNFTPDEGKISGPGPGKYMPNYDLTLSSIPKMSIHGQITSSRKQEQTPEPLGPFPNDTGPKYTIGRKDYLSVIPGCVF